MEFHCLSLIFPILREGYLQNGIGAHQLFTKEPIEKYLDDVLLREFLRQAFFLTELVNTEKGA